MKKTILFSIIMLYASLLFAQPPYGGTIFIDPDIITSSDPSAIQSTTYSGQGAVTMYDRRVPGWVTVNAYLFDVIWDDGITSVAQINEEFGSIAAARVEAEKYAFLIGQLPRCLREDVDEIWIHQGVEAFGGGNNSILIHTGQTINYENDGILEETLVHEAAHTSLDASHATSSGWINAQNMDGEFISTYAQDNPIREDIAESYLTWLAVRYRADQISAQDYANITQTIPNRLNYFDSINCDLYPFEEQSVGLENVKKEAVRIYPNPATDLVYIDSEKIDQARIKLYSLLGQDFTGQTSYYDGLLNVSSVPEGYYVLRIEGVAVRFYKK